jgi:hypothetical protein
MGWEADFYGRLEFTKALNAVELRQLNRILDEDRYDLCVTIDEKGLRYCAEKSRDMVGTVNHLIDEACKVIAGFGLKGSLYASTEYEPYTWLLKIGPDGGATQERCSVKELWRHSKSEYLARQRLKVRMFVRGPIVEARLRHKNHEGKKGSIRKAADAVCSFYLDTEAVVGRKMWRLRHGAAWPEMRR